MTAKKLLASVGQDWFIRIRGASALTRVRMIEYHGTVWRVQPASPYELAWDGEAGVDFEFVTPVRPAEGKSDAP